MELRRAFRHAARRRFPVGSLKRFFAFFLPRVFTIILWVVVFSNMFFNVHPENLGKMNPFWRSYFSDGLVQPPTSSEWHSVCHLPGVVIQISKVAPKSSWNFRRTGATRTFLSKRRCCLKCPDFSKRDPPHNEGKKCWVAKIFKNELHLIGVLTFTFETFLSIWCRFYGRCFPWCFQFFTSGVWEMIPAELIYVFQNGLFQQLQVEMILFKQRSVCHDRIWLPPIVYRGLKWMESLSPGFFYW